LDDEEIVAHSARSAHKAVVLQPDAKVGFAVILDDIAWSSKTPQEMSIVHSASKHLQTRPFRTEDASFMIVVAPTAWVLRALLGLCVIIHWAVPSVYQSFRLSDWSAQSVAD
jgi:hypothetical protein